MKLIKNVARRNLLFVKRYYSYFPYYLNEHSIEKLKIFGQFFGLLLLSAIIGFTFLNNATPYGFSTKYTLQKGDGNITSLVPKSRVNIETKNGESTFKLNGNLIYFSSKMPFIFDTASVKLVYKVIHPDQTLSIGYQDSSEYHYAYKPYYVSYLNDNSWIKNGYTPVLYQREQRYTSLTEFNNNPPEDAVIGTYEYNSPLNNPDNVNLNNYQPSNEWTEIETPLRGKHELYVYLNNEPFNMKILKQDLNWKKGPDIITIKIYKDTDLVYETVAEDDGIQDDSKTIKNANEIVIENPGDEMPEKGVYKVVLDADSDTIIKKISTNLHKIVFANKIFPATNNQIYPSIVATTSATTVYTNALTLSASTYHVAGLQNILVGDQVLGVNTLHVNTYLPPKDNISKVVIPQNDVILNGFMGYFAFSEDQFFLPTKYHVLPITKKEDVGLVDYILTDYRPSWKEGDWQVNEQYFDLRDAYIKDGKLSWVIKAPKLKERGGEVIIKDIQITFHKKGWL